MMYNKIKKLAERNRYAKTTEEKESIAQEMASLEAENPRQYSEALERLIGETKSTIDDLTLTEKLGDMPKLLSMSFIAEKYFNKSRAWLTQRLNGNIVNGKRVSLNEQELDTFKSALKDIAIKLNNLSDSL